MAHSTRKLRLRTSTRPNPLPPASDPIPEFYYSTKKPRTSESNMSARRADRKAEVEAELMAELRQKCQEQYERRHGLIGLIGGSVGNHAPAASTAKSAPPKIFINAAFFAKLPGELRNQVYTYLHYSDAALPVPSQKASPLRIGTARISLPNKRFNDELRSAFDSELACLFARDNGAVQMPSGNLITWNFINDDTPPGGRLYLSTPLGIDNLGRYQAGSCFFWQHGPRIRQTSLQPDYVALLAFTTWLDSEECAPHAETKMYKHLKALLKMIERCSPKLPGISAPPARAIREPLMRKFPDVRFRWCYGEANLYDAW